VGLVRRVKLEKALRRLRGERTGAFVEEGIMLTVCIKFGK